MLDVREAAVRAVAEARRAPVALLFGAERTGLQNEHLDASHVLLRIPASRDVRFAESRHGRAAGEPMRFSVPAATPAMPESPREVAEAPLATPPQMQQLYSHLEQVLQEVDFKDRTKAGTHLMSRIRRFLQRAELDQNEVNILRGILTAIQNRRRMAGAPPAPKADP